MTQWVDGTISLRRIQTEIGSKRLYEIYDADGRMLAEVTTGMEDLYLSSHVPCRVLVRYERDRLSLEL